jgi:hypothetical protein
MPLAACRLFSPSTLKPMILTQEQTQQMLEAAKPLIKWLNENTHPHCFAQVDHTRVELVEGIATSITTEFLKDWTHGL